MFRATGEPISTQYKPAKPLTVKGRAIKYLSPRGQPNYIDVHPRNRGSIADVGIPLWITEGIKKGDSLTSRGCCVVTLTGVFNWRSKYATLGDWEDVPLKGRLAGQNPTVPLGELREYCKRRGWDISGEFTDVGVSGAKERRPQLDRLLAACRRRLVDAVVVYRYDRFARSLRQLVGALAEFEALGIQFVSLHEGVDTSTPNGRLVFGIFAAIAEFERELIRDRVRSGIAAARARGKRLGRPRRDVDVSRVAALRAERRSWRDVGRELGVGVATARAAFHKRAENLSESATVSD